MSAAHAGSKTKIGKDALSDGRLPIGALTIQEIRKAMADDDWRQAKVPLAAPVGTLPAPSAGKQTSQKAQPCVSVRQ
jgi:hypothetical protein